MSGEGSQTVDTAITTANAEITDAAAQAAEQARIDAERTQSMADQTAANLAESARQRTAEIEAAVSGVLAGQESRLSELSQHQQELREWQEAQNLRWTEAESQSNQMAESLRGIAEGLARLTPPPLPEAETPPEVSPETAASEAEAARKAAEQKPARPRHNWI